MCIRVSTNGRKRILAWLAMLAMVLLLMQGCASAPRRTGFIPGDIELQPVPRDQSMLWWEHPEFSWHAYSKVILEPVQIRIESAQAERKVNLGELQALAEDLRAKVAAKLAPEYPVVEASGGDVLRIRAAITDVDPANPVLNVVTALALFVPMDMGGVSIEAEFIDSVSGRRMAAMADQKRGTPLQLAGSLKRFGHVRTAFDQWAEALKTALVKNP